MLVERFICFAEQNALSCGAHVWLCMCGCLCVVLIMIIYLFIYLFIYLNKLVVEAKIYHTDKRTTLFTVDISQGLSPGPHREIQTRNNGWADNTTYIDSFQGKTVIGDYIFTQVLALTRNSVIVLHEQQVTYMVFLTTQLQ